MIEICGKIDLISAKNFGFTAMTDFEGNNISARMPLAKKVEVKNPFIIGSSRLGEGHTFSEGEKYFISKGLSYSTTNGISLDKAYSFKLSSTDAFDSFTIAFDTENNRHPDSITVDGTEYYDNDAIFSIFNLENKTSHNVVISNWNVTRSPLIISGIYINLGIDINRRNLISFNSQISDRSDLKVPSFGVISNKGNLSIKDIDGEIADYNENGQLINSKLNMYIRNSLSKKSEPIGTFRILSLDYDDKDFTANLTIGDRLEEWQNINVEGIDFYREETVDSQPHRNFKWIYDYLLNITHNNGFTNMLSFAELDEDTQEILNCTYMKYPMLESDNLWAQWQKLCVVCQAHIYQNPNGKIVFEYKGGN